MRAGVVCICAVLGALTLASPTAAAPAPGEPVDPAVELANFGKQNERAAHAWRDPARALDSRVRAVDGVVEVAGIVLRDPSRNPITPCAARADVCAGDTRAHDWGGRYGLARPVLWTNRNGATISGTLWAPFGRDGVAAERLPAIVIAPGGAQAPETIYWHQAQLLAERGYVVLTFETQGQGRSDTFGFGAATLNGFPSEQYSNFRDGLTDALDFVYSDPSRPFMPRGPGAARQRARAAAGRVDAFNPLHGLVSDGPAGVAGHSFGAVAASEVASSDERVGAVVGWDWLAPDACDLYETGDQSFCFGQPRRPLPPRVPGLNVSNDYGFGGVPNVVVPEPDAHSRAFEPFVEAGVDTMSVVIRGGGHYECPYIPSELLGATLRGEDLCAWYTAAWFDKYLRGDPSADARLLTGRWRSDAAGAAADGGGDGNLFSFYERSRAAFTLSDGSGRFTCDDLRAGCEP